jgi:16S rRNA (guanine(527)-N(7))-methyltransferase RsmG
MDIAPEPEPDNTTEGKAVDGAAGTEGIGHFLKKHEAEFGIELSADAVARLEEFGTIVAESNDVLHLVAPCTAEEFAVRHMLESLAILEYLPAGARVIDIGPGGGFPSLPCLLVRPDLRAVLVEAKLKKSVYLNDAVKRLALSGRAEVVGRQFEEIARPAGGFVTCRALDKFTQKLPRLVKWSKCAKLLLFGGPNLGEALKKEGLNAVSRLLPLSQQRFLYVIDKPRQGG